MPKLAQILKRPSCSRQVCVSVFFLSDHCIKQIDSMLPWVCSVIDHRGRQNVVKATVTHSPAARVPLLCFYDILTSSVIYYWTDPGQHGIYLLTMTVKSRGVARIFQRGGHRVILSRDTIRGSSTIYGLYRCSPSCISVLSRIIAAWRPILTKDKSRWRKYFTKNKF